MSGPYRTSPAPCAHSRWEHVYLLFIPGAPSVWQCEDCGETASFLRSLRLDLSWRSRRIRIRFTSDDEGRVFDNLRPLIQTAIEVVGSSFDVAMKIVLR